MKFQTLPRLLVAAGTFPRDARHGTIAISGAPAYLNPSLPIDQRVDDLVSRMTLEEKVFLRLSTWRRRFPGFTCRLQLVD